MVVHGLGETSHPPGLLHDHVHTSSCGPLPAVLPTPIHSALFHFIGFVRTCDYSFYFHPHGLHFPWADITSAMSIAISSTLCTKLNKYLSSCVYKEKMLLSYLTKPLGLFLHVSTKSQVIGLVRRPSESSGLYWESEAFYSSSPQNKQKNTTKNWKISIWYLCVLEQVTISYIRIKFSPLNVRVRRKKY